MTRTRIDFTPSPDLGLRLAELAAGVAKIASEKCESAADGGVPVDEGDLKDSITSGVAIEDGRPIGFVVANIDYAAFVEFGTGDTPAQPFLRPALGKALR